MALAGQKTKADYIEWNKLQSLILKLERDGEPKFALLVSIGIYTGLRISDILSLTWSQVIEKEIIEITEKKTKKFRKIKINQHLQDIITRNYNYQKLENQIFLNRFNTSTMSVQYINRKLKLIANQYNIKKNTSNISCHSLRKSFGRRVFEQNDNSEKSLILLSEIFNHTSLKTTKTYICIRENEISDAYDNL